MKKTKYIETKNQLIAEIEKTLSPVLEKVGERLLDDLREQISKDTYKYDYYPNKRYYTKSIYQEDDDNYSSFPTGEFIEAWKVTKGKNKKDSIIQIKYDAKRMSRVAHRSIVDNRDARWYLDRILNVDGYTSPLMVGSFEEGTIRPVSKLRKPYWDNFIKKIKSKSLISKYMKQEAKKLGITLK